MNDETLEALLGQLGIAPPRRPAPSRSPAFDRARERFTTRPPAIDPNSMQSVASQYAPRVRREDLRPLPTRQGQEREYARLQQSPREAPAHQAPTNQFAGAGQMGLEMTGLPSVRRSAAAFADNRPREGFEEGAIGALSLATLGVGGRSAMPGRPRAPVAEPRVGALRPPPPRPAGSVLPVREREPFRNSMRGGSDDLMEAARPQGALRPPPSPDAGPSSGGSAPDGFEREVVYRGLRRPYEATEGEQFFTSSADVAQRYGDNVIAGTIRPGRTADIDARGGGWNEIAVEDLPPDIRARMAPGDSDRFALTTNEVSDLARAAGYDSVSFRNIRDAAMQDTPPHDVRVVFRSQDFRPNAPDGSPSPTVPRRSELDRMVADARRANPRANAEDLGAIRWVQDSDGNYHVGHAMEVDHQALLDRLNRSGVRVPEQTRENRGLRGHFYRDESGQWRSITMEGGESVSLDTLAPRRNRADGSPSPAGALPDGAMSALRAELREHDFDVPAQMPDLPQIEVPLSELRPGQIGSLDRADARSYAALTTDAPPILVRRQGRNGWHIIDGNRRAEAARLRGDQNIRVIDATGLFE